MGEKKDRFKVWKIKKEKKKLQFPKLQFPKHWINPPKIQTRDYRKLPGEYGQGSSTLAKWIAENLKTDKQKGEAIDRHYLDKKLDEKCQSHLLFLKNHTLSTQM